jgi:hypothetical protein
MRITLTVDQVINGSVENAGTTHDVDDAAAVALLNAGVAKPAGRAVETTQDGGNDDAENADEKPARSRKRR